ncbi:zinc finger CCHC-type and RNA-binding motif-containing protein 1 [Procambarus clarkii]|uniref:zinc finger CCHC-type and RNA-binding motif-containing protein 1 n=1 Tax=Procambarus clarkii TaxID=6728 RepID=UPI001E674EFF|nr:zinc finger CCHC-type and RNA-binding motif-containing protein 1-like [Procambarus clarkii]XP_045602364.1 zinc finger CCHC-type and RNA-binding motif-containing protein 1-like [Procambarus clarkii]XP_045602365.1 zinc finger CCHC-type and RNA-binding motif-containing protein 1-like [Procambarus clarkii]
MANIRGGSSGRPTLAPSRSTVYVSNLPFSLTNTDLHKIFEKFGKLVRVTILRDKNTRKSRGVAFMLYLTREEAQACVRGTDGCEMFGRTLKASIAKDNGRAPEFIRRREYLDKSRCYECGEGGHLSYSCPKNLLGEREPVKKKSKKRKKEFEEDSQKSEILEASDDDDAGDQEINFEDESLSGAIRYQQELREAEAFQSRMAAGEFLKCEPQVHRAKIKQSSYFSDEEELSDS